MFVFDLTQDSHSQEEKFPRSKTNESLFARSTNTNIISLLDSPAPCLQSFPYDLLASSREMILLDESILQEREEAKQEEEEAEERQIVYYDDYCTDGPFSDWQIQEPPSKNGFHREVYSWDVEGKSNGGFLSTEPNEQFILDCDRDEDDHDNNDDEDNEDDNDNCSIGTCTGNAIGSNESDNDDEVVFIDRSKESISNRFVCDPPPPPSLKGALPSTIIAAADTKGIKSRMGDIFDLLSEKENQITFSQTLSLPTSEQTHQPLSQRTSNKPLISASSTMIRQTSSSSTVVTASSSSSAESKESGDRRQGDERPKDEDHFNVDEAMVGGKRSLQRQRSKDKSNPIKRAKSVSRQDTLPPPPPPPSSSSATATMRSTLSQSQSATSTHQAQPSSFLNPCSSISVAALASTRAAVVDNEDSQQSKNGDATQSRYERPLSSLNLSYDYEITLLIDSRERSSSLIMGSLITSNIPCALATLAVGDFLWIAKPRNWTPPAKPTMTTAVPTSSTKNAFELMMQSSAAASNPVPIATVPAGPQTIEEVSVVLDCIVERKTVADLGSSLMDGRYYDQKFRIKTTEIPCRCYIIEGEHLVLPMQMKAISPHHIKTAMVTSHIDHEMHIIRTRSMDHSIMMLQYLHRKVASQFQTVLGQYREPSNAGHRLQQFRLFSDFQEIYNKRVANTYRELFGYQIRQINGCSGSTALALMKRFGTTASFMRFLRSNDRLTAEKAIEAIQKEGESSGRIGPKLAKKIVAIYSDTY